MQGEEAKIRGGRHSRLLWGRAYSRFFDEDVLVPGKLTVCNFYPKFPSASVHTSPCCQALCNYSVYIWPCLISCGIAFIEDVSKKEDKVNEESC